MHSRQGLFRVALLVVGALLLGGSPPPAPSRAAPARAQARYIVTLAAAPAPADSGLAAAAAADAARGRALAAVGQVAGGPVEPLYVYRHALNGFAVALTPAEAAAVAGLPGVARVTRETIRTAQTDRGPGFIGAAQGALRPTLFASRLAGAAGAAGRAVSSYLESAGRLQVQLFYSGLGGAPTAAELRLGGPGEAGTPVASLAGLAVGAPGAEGGYQGLLTLDAAAEAALFAGRLFYRLDGPAGSIRGQLAPGLGEGVVVGVLDSGINVGHPSFQDPAPDGYDHENPLGAGIYLGVCSPADPRFDPLFACNDKLIGAYTYPDTLAFPDPQGRASPRDNHSHGSHVAGTAVGNVVAGAPGGPLSGVAPHANLIIYDVCGTNLGELSCSSLALVAALDQAVADGVDVINFSIGGASSDPWADPEAAAMLGALGAGIFVAVSAGNDGPDASTIGSPGNAPWVLGVAASTHDRRFLKELGGFSGGSDGLRPATLTGTGVAPALGTATPLVDAGALSPPNRFCGPFTPAQAAQVAGKIVVCSDPGFGAPWGAGEEVWAAGAAGAVFIGPAEAGRFAASAYARPAVQLGGAEGAALRVWLSGCADCRATIGATTRALDLAGDSLAAFSSRGPEASVPDVLKPDLAAPGVAILAAGADYDAATADYVLLDGTSMAAPHAAGLAALIRQIHPDWTPAEIRSAMMLTAETRMRKEDGATPADPFDYGAGRARASAAFAGFVLDEGEAAFRAADPRAGGDPRALNLASVADDSCLISCTFTRTLRSTLGVPLTWNISTTAGAGFTLATDPPGALTLGPGERRTVSITATAAGTSRAYGFGAVTFTPASPLAPTAAIPVALRTVRSSLTEPVVIGTTRASGSSALRVRAEAIADLTAEVYGLVRLAPETHLLAEDPTPFDPTDIEAGGIFTRSLSLPAGNTRLRAEIRGSTAPDLDLFLLADLDGDGVDELLCESVSPGNLELCDLAADDMVAGRPAPLEVTVAVQNFTGSGAAEDRFELLVGAVGRDSAGNLAASGPATVPGGETFELTLSWQLGALGRGDVYIGVLTLGSAPATPGDLGAVPVTIFYDPAKTRLPLVAR